MSNFLRLKQVVERVALGKSTVWQWVKEGRFPQPVKLSPTVTVWYSDEIDAFIEGTWQPEKKEG